MVIRVNTRREVPKDWSELNPILGDGELGIENDENNVIRFKFGNGINKWNDLDYSYPEAGSSKMTLYDIEHGFNIAGHAIYIREQDLPRLKELIIAVGKSLNYYEDKSVNIIAGNNVLSFDIYCWENQTDWDDPNTAYSVYNTSIALPANRLAVNANIQNPLFLRLEGKGGDGSELMTDYIGYGYIYSDTDLIVTVNEFKSSDIKEINEIAKLIYLIPPELLPNNEWINEDVTITSDDPLVDTSGLYMEKNPALGVTILRGILSRTGIINGQSYPQKITITGFSPSSYNFDTVFNQLNASAMSSTSVTGVVNSFTVGRVDNSQFETPIKAGDDSFVWEFSIWRGNGGAWNPAYIRPAGHVGTNVTPAIIASVVIPIFTDKSKF